MNLRKWLPVLLLGAILAVGGLSANSLRPNPSGDLQSIRGRLQGDEKPRPGGKLSSATARAEEKAIRAAAESFSAAYNKGDLEAVLSHWSSEGEYVSESGKSYRGKAQLQALLKKAMANTRGQKHSIVIDQLRFLKSDVAQEEGHITLASPDGEYEKGRYVALWIKMEGKWLLASVRDLADASEDDRPAAYQRLRSLSWLLGEWQEKDGETTISIRWAPGHAYLLMDYHVKRGDETLQVHQRIGWDPANQRIRSWVFDSTGGFGDAVWEREGNTWTVRGEGTFPDGKLARAVYTWKLAAKDTIRWTARDRDVDEVPLPDIDATYVRKPKVEKR